jgi:colanic acid/amylovoran biosynthesis glycosyltransferase
MFFCVTRVTADTITPDIISARTAARGALQATLPATTRTVPAQSPEHIRKPLKILIIETYFPPVSSTAVLNQITGLIDQGHTVHIYSKYRGPLEWAHTDIHKYNLMSSVTFEHLPKNLDSYDIIYCMFGYRGKDLVDALRRKPLRHAKLITCFRGADITKYVQRNPRYYYRRLFIKGDLFLPVCHYFVSKLTKLGCKPQKIKVHPSAIDCSLFAYKERQLEPEKPIKLVSVSRLIKKKGLEYSIRAVAELVKKYPKIQYTIVGFGTLQQELEQLIRSLELSNHVKLVGRLSQEEIADLLGTSHIFVLPSVTDKNGDQEGIPNSLKEAMAVGLPVVSTRHAGIPELVRDGYSGFLVPEHDYKTLATKIEYLITHPEIWPTLCKAARETIEREYERNAVNKKLNALFYSLVKK